MIPENYDLKTYAVLYVDDEQQAGKYFRKGLEKEFRVLTATNVGEALAILDKEGNSVGVVITDQRMPGQSGVELLTKVRQQWPAAVRILITAYSDLDSAIAAVNAGAVYKYITKPADFPLLRESLIEALALHRQTIERDALAATLRELEAQRRATQAAEAQREQLQQRLITASREAGRAEVATGILHNVGNVLNSVNISAAVIDKVLGQSRLTNLHRAMEMLEEHQADMPQFLAEDERGKRLPGYILKLAGVLDAEHKAVTEELASLRRSLEHIGQVVAMQQSYATESTMRAPVSPAELFEESLRLNLASFGKHNVQLVRQFADIPPVMLDKHKVLQILINLVSNANNALKQREIPNKQITLRTELGTTENGEAVIRFHVIDNGEGIARENLTRIFTHGFTTRKEGHGFGLHSSANTAHEMGGSVNVSSDGPELGATFTLELPIPAATAAEPNRPAPKVKVSA